MAGALLCCAGQVAAQGTPAARRAAPVYAAPVLSHHSTLRVPAQGLPLIRAIQLGRNKSMLVELPRDLRDVVVSNPEIMDAVVQTSNRVYLIGKKTGQSNAFFFDTRGDQILTLEMTVEHDTGPLEALFQRLLPGSRIRAEILNDTVILTGSVRSAIDSNRAGDLASRFLVPAGGENDSRAKAKVVNMLAVEGDDQIMLRVTVAEVSREVLKQFGINIGASINAASFSTSILTQNALPLTAAAGLGILPFPGILTGAPPPAGQIPDPCLGGVCNYSDSEVFTNSGSAGGWQFGNQRITQAVRALERDGLIKILAEPNLTAVSGEAAKFLAGGEFPIPVVDTNGALSVTFKEFGIGLAFTPNALSEGRISLKIETEVSELSNEGAVTLSSISIPALKKRLARSTVELPSGGSLALAGLLREDIRQNIDGFPGLKDVPILGTLFRSRDFIKKESELVVIVTPYTVRPVARQHLARPGDGLMPASDRAANFLGHLNRVYGRSATLPDGGLKGDYGFIVE